MEGHLTRRKLIAGAGTAAFGIAAAGTLRKRLAAGSPDRSVMFFLTHYELIGGPKKPGAVRYHSDGHPFAKAPNGHTVQLAGGGAFDPNRRSGSGGGRYLIRKANGVTSAEGAWRVLDFISFDQLSGWWDPGFTEVGWQGPTGSVSFPGFAALRVDLGNQGTGVLMMW